MKLNNKKINKEFAPESHWYKLLILICIIFISVIVYGLYSFYSIKNQIIMMENQAKNNSQVATPSGVKGKSLNDILEVFNTKEIQYKKLLNSPIINLNISTSTASTTVATTTK